jgi:hypothetical protein
MLISYYLILHSPPNIYKYIYIYIYICLILFIYVSLKKKLIFNICYISVFHYLTTCKFMLIITFLHLT